MELGSVAPPPVAVDAAAARRRRRRRTIMAVLLVMIAAGVFRPRPSAREASQVPAGDAVQRPARVVPDSVRIKVEVVNATATRGLGRLATAWLRDKGFDVVATTTAAEKDRRDSSLVLDRSGHAAWASMLATAIGGARGAARPHTLRFLDLTVLVGRSWRPPPQTLYP